MNTLKTLVILLLIAAHAGQAQNPDSKFQEIKINNNGDYDFEGAGFLKQELRNADIILLGEPSHNAKYYPFKIQLVKYLHDQLGFDVIAFESGLFQMEMVNADIKRGEETATAFEKGLFQIWTSTFEFEELYAYLDSLKRAGSPMEITGFDCQISASNASKRFVAEIEQALKNNGIPVEKRPLQILQAQLENLESKKNLTDDFDDESLNELTKLEKSISAITSMSILHQSLVGFIGHFIDLFRNRILEKLRNGNYDFIDNNVRDSLMAMQMMYIHQQLYPGKKIIGWGANLHFSNQVQHLDTDHPAKGYRPMGLHLKEKLGDKVFFLAVTTNDNIPNTIEWDLGKSEVGAAWLSTKALQEKSIASCCFGDALIGKGNWPNVVDGMLYFNSSPIKKNDKDANANFIKGEIVDAKTRQPVSYASIAVNGTNLGTASEINGGFMLKVDSSQLNKTLTISSIGYKAKHVSLTNVLRKKNGFQIRLTPEVELLREVVINAKAPDAKEIIKEAIGRIAENYVQSPFNMEFYSALSVLDTVAKHDYKIESIFTTYYEGYLKGSKKSYRIIQKRESGDYFMKEKTHGNAQWPVVELAFNDIFSNEHKKQIFSEDQFNKINLTLTGVKLQDSDTVFVMTYDYLVHGEIYISARDYAIVKHVTTSSGRGFKNRMEIIYRKEAGKYFPYVANGDYLHLYKVDGKKKYLKISNRAILKRFKLEDIDSFEQNYELWHPKNVDYSKDYWDTNYPQKN